MQDHEKRETVKGKNSNAVNKLPKMKSHFRKHKQLRQWYHTGSALALHCCNVIQKSP